MTWEIDKFIMTFTDASILFIFTIDDFSTGVELKSVEQQQLRAMAEIIPDRNSFWRQTEPTMELITGK